MKLQPILDHIVIKMEKAPEKVGSFYLADSVRVEQYIAVVTHTGPDVEIVKPGDRLVLVPRGGIEFEFEGEKYLVITKESIVGTISLDD